MGWEEERGEGDEDGILMVERCRDIFEGDIWLEFYFLKGGRRRFGVYIWGI